MGFNTTVVILNDEISEIENDTSFGYLLAAAMRDVFRTKPGEVVRIGHYSSHVVSTGHADFKQIIQVRGNIGSVMKQPKKPLEPYKS